ncbi:MAG: glycosyltransferase family 4 protein [Methylococcales bacterium]
MKLRIARVSTVKFFVYTQLYTQLKMIKSSGMELTVISSEDDGLSDDANNLSEFNFIGVNIPRNINPLKDLLALLKLIRIFRDEQFDIVHSTTPKAGLLCAIAGKISGVKIRLHTFTGQPWATMTGLKRMLLLLCDKFIAYLNTCCYTDSLSQKKFLIENGVGKDFKLLVLGQGSLAGVDLSRFNPSRYSVNNKLELRKELTIADGSLVILFVGRVSREKGVKELLAAFEYVLSQDIDAYLLFVGPFEPDGQVCLDEISNLMIKEKIRTVGYSGEPEKYMAISDVLCLPSYREGFGTVVIEAAAMALPAVGTDIYGLSDAVVNGETGVLVPARNSQLLGVALSQVLCNDDLRTEMAAKAQKRVLDYFDSSYIGDLVIKEYERFSVR